MNREHRSGRAGVTLLEVVVVVAVLGLLMALILPAVQAAREASRRAQCLQHLSQVGIAFHNYYQAADRLPPLNSHRGFSLHVTLLPYLDQRPLHNAINLAPGYLLALDANATVALSAPGFYLCPSDSGSGPEMTSYCGNSGAGFCPSRYLGVCDNGGLPWKPEGSVGLSAIRDGASQTVAAAEWVTLRFGDRPDRLAAVRELPTTIDDFPRFVAACDESENSRLDFRGKGTRWMWGDFSDTIYNHHISINRISCKNAGDPVLSAWTAGSRHPGGANVLFVDGHGQFLKATTDVAIWRALGTRGGAEVVSSGAF